MTFAALHLTKACKKHFLTFICLYLPLFTFIYLYLPPVALIFRVQPATGVNPAPEPD
jgi:hypothetical protein